MTRKLDRVLGCGLSLVATAMAGAGCVFDQDSSPPVDMPALIAQTQRDLDAAAAADPATFARVRPVRPTLKCIDVLGNRHYRAHLGYASSATAAIAIPVGFLNRFWPAPADRGQPTTFAPGAQADVLQVPFDGSAASIWVLGNHFVVATRFSKPCPPAGGVGGAAGSAGAGGGGGNAGAGGAPACPSSCDDRDPCSVDLCSAATDFQCQHVDAPDGTACDDHNPCTKGDTCRAGVCTAGPLLECLPKDDCHMPGSCNAADGTCASSSTPPRPDGSQCGAANACGVRGQCHTGTCVATVATDCGPACDQCTYGPTATPGVPDMCSASPEGCFNCVPDLVGCDVFTDPADRAACQNLYACIVAPSHPGSVVPGMCMEQGDPLACWCGTHPADCGATPAQANGPCVQQVVAAAKTSDPTLIFQRFIDPGYPLGRAVNLAGCRQLYCPVACRFPVPCPPPADACHVQGVRDPFTGLCSNPPAPLGKECSDGQGCTVGDFCNGGGTCLSGPICPAADACHQPGVCIDGASCSPGAAMPDGTKCSGGGACGQVPVCLSGVCTFPLIECNNACQQCTFGPFTGQPDICSSSPEGCANCFAGTDGCESIADAGDRALCQDLYACLVAPTHPGSVVAGACIHSGDPLQCWCGTNPRTCLTSNAPPTQANGPCLQQVFAAAKTTDAGTINQRFVDPAYPLGRAVDLAVCQGNYCAAPCGIPF